MGDVAALRTLRTLRTYEPIWLRIKSKEVCVIKCKPTAVRYIKKGVIQEKWRDDGFKLIFEVEKLWLHFEYSDQTEELKIELRSKFGLEKGKASQL